MTTTETSALHAFEGTDVVAASIEIPDAAGGLRDALAERLRTVPLDGDLLVIEPYVAVRSAEDIVVLLATHPLVTVIQLTAMRNELGDRIRRLAAEE